MVRFKFLDWLIEKVNNANMSLQSKAIDMQVGGFKKKKKTKWLWEK
jgi:hypothetical protein